MITFSVSSKAWTLDFLESHFRIQACPAWKHYDSIVHKRLTLNSILVEWHLISGSFASTLSTSWLDVKPRVHIITWILLGWYITPLWSIYILDKFLCWRRASEISFLCCWYSRAQLGCLPNTLIGLISISDLRICATRHSSIVVALVSSSLEIDCFFKWCNSWFSLYKAAMDLIFDIFQSEVRNSTVPDVRSIWKEV